MKILQFLKSNWKVTLIIAGVLFVILFYSFKQGQIKRLTAKITTLEMGNFALNNDRLNLEFINKKLTFDNSVISVKNDSLKKVLAKYQAQLVEMKKSHQAELDDLKKIPPDIVYVNLNNIFPNVNNEPLKYPFAAQQIGLFYRNTIELGNLTEEYIGLGKSLNTCLSLNNGFESSISNLNKQISNYKSDIAKCDLQGVNYTKNIEILNKQVKNKTFWNRTLLGTELITVLLFVLK
jgi:dynactin complex subunit